MQTQTDSVAHKEPSYDDVKKLIAMEERIVMVLQLLTQLECIIKEYNDDSHDLHEHIFKQIALGIMYFIRYIFNNQFREEMLLYIGKRYNNNLGSVLNDIDSVIFAVQGDLSSHSSTSIPIKMSIIRNDTSLLMYKLYSKILQAQSEYVKLSMRPQRENKAPLDFSPQVGYNDPSVKEVDLPHGSQKSNA